MKRFTIYLLIITCFIGNAYAQNNNKGLKAINEASKQIKEQSRKMSQIVITEIPKAVIKVKNGDMDEFKILSPAEFNALKKTIVETADSISPKTGIIRDSTSTKYIDMIKRFFKWLSE
jgi:hypothetical protein